MSYYIKSEYCILCHNYPSVSDNLCIKIRFKTVPLESYVLMTLNQTHTHARTPLFVHTERADLYAHKLLSVCMKIT